MQIFPVVEYRRFAIAVRQMIIKKLLDQRLIDAFDINIALANPVCKVGQSGKVIIYPKKIS
jgi:hypothetical protein